MSHRVRITKDAEADYEERLAALARRSPAAARKLHAEYLKALVRLRDFPFSCGLSYEHARFAEEIRHLLFGIRPNRRFRALFTIRGDEVVVLAVRAGGERPVGPKDIATEE